VKRTGLLVLAILLLASGCAKKNQAAAPPPASTSTAAASASPSDSATPTTSPEVVNEFTVDGAGPYQLGVMLASLQATNSLADVKTGAETCPQNTTAAGTGDWSDIRLSFRPDGKLYLAINRSTTIPTPSGAWLGTTLAQLKKIYAGVSSQEMSQGTRKAFLVTTISGRGILFDLGDGQTVMAMIAGDGTYLKQSFQGGTDFC
jgi:hypothetical protein